MKCRSRERHFIGNRPNEEKTECVSSSEIDASLPNPGATALNQNNQHDHSKHASYNLDHRGTVHVVSPFVLVREQSFE